MIPSSFRTQLSQIFFQIMSRSRQRISPACKNQSGELKGTSLHKSDFVNFLVSDRYKTLFCYVPKVACGNWKRIFLVLNGHFNTTTEISGPMAHESGLIDTLDKYSVEEIRYKLLKYKKVVFVREPLERVLSAYRNKFTTTYNKRYHHRYGVEIIKKYRKNLTREITDEDQVTFDEFVKYLIDLRPDRRDVHWELQHNLCFPCSVSYDFIGKYESLKLDAARALEVMGASERITFPDIGKNRTGKDTKTLMRQFYSQISVQDFVRLQKIYEMDYNLFEYRKPTYSEVLSGSQPTLAKKL